MNKKNPKVDGVLGQEKKWQEEFETLRTIILDCQLAEELKWYQPCYTLQKKNVVLIHGFKEFCALLFFKGALLKDPNRILVRPGQHQAARLLIPMKVVSDSDLIPVTHSDAKPVTVGAKRRWHCYGA